MAQGVATVQAQSPGTGDGFAGEPYSPDRSMWGKVKKYRLEIIMVLPFVVYLVFFMFYPVAESIVRSFLNQNTNEVTLDNYRTIMNRSQFNDAFVNTIGITAIGVTLQMLIGLGIAFMLSREFHGRGIFRSIVLIPMGVPTIVAGAAMLYIVGFNGYLNRFLMDVGLVDIPVYWQQSGIRGMFIIALADIWKALPLVVLILLAGLESIPGDVYEAADVDGAGGWRKFRDVTLPLLMPAITMALILRAIDAFRIFDIAMVLGGQAIPVMSSFVYTEYRAQNVNLASAAAVILLLMIVVFVIAYFFLVERRGGDEK
ncbi:MAG TPA: sugar ABC transporter permease [Thermomicrobiales bacterium]|jgi:trehalose transport system permease protein|nr:sugar ABC transporter permease [Thermomicrobiales bacterium]